MGKRIDELIRSLSEVFEGEPWYGDSVMRKLENVPYVIGYKSCNPESHSVSQIVGHLIAWKKFALEKLKNNSDFDIEIDSQQDWPNIEVNSQEEWENLKHDLVMAQGALYDFLKTKKDESFLEKKVKGRDYNFNYLLQGLIQHDIYHLGQIGLIESQLKKKKSDTGIFRS